MKKKICIITTGGTIAMKEAEGGGLVPAVTGADLTATVPGLADVADIDVQEFSNVPSGWMRAEDMFALGKHIDTWSHLYDGFVVTHGTDTLEETAFFLSVVLRSPVPVCVTGAMRGASDLGYDGPANLLGAVRVVAHDTAPHMVTVCLNDRIYDVMGGTKRHTVNVDTFGDPEYGPIGYVYSDTIRYVRCPVETVKISVDQFENRVWILPAWSGMDGDSIDSALSAGVKGIVIDGLGCGNVPPRCKEAILRAREKHIPVVLTTRVPTGYVVEEYGYDGSAASMKESGLILGGSLSAWKARLLLAIALGTTTDVERIRTYFER